MMTIEVNLTACGRFFVTSILAVGFAVALPRVEYATSVRLALEFHIWAR